MVDRRKVSPGHHEHNDQTRSAALRRRPDIFTPCRADVDVVWTCSRGLMRMTNCTPGPPHVAPGALMRMANPTPGPAPHGWFGGGSWGRVACLCVRRSRLWRVGQLLRRV